MTKDSGVQINELKLLPPDYEIEAGEFIQYFRPNQIFSVPKGIKIREVIDKIRINEKKISPKLIKEFKFKNIDTDLL